MNSMKQVPSAYHTGLMKPSTLNSLSSEKGNNYDSIMKHLNETLKWNTWHYFRTLNHPSGCTLLRALHLSSSFCFSPFSLFLSPFLTLSSFSLSHFLPSLALSFSLFSVYLSFFCLYLIHPLPVSLFLTFLFGFLFLFFTLFSTTLPSFYLPLSLSLFHSPFLFLSLFIFISLLLFNFPFLYLSLSLFICIPLSFPPLLLSLSLSIPLFFNSISQSQSIFFSPSFPFSIYLLQFLSLPIFPSLFLLLIPFLISLPLSVSFNISPFYFPPPPFFSSFISTFPPSLVSHFTIPGTAVLSLFLLILHLIQV